MSSYSIYQKPCPTCGAVVAADTKRCDCGYSFESSSSDAPSPEEQWLQEEELFEAYLEARVDQTVARVESARAEFAADPVNQRKVDALLQAVQEALTLRDQREAQAAKSAQARETVQMSRAKPAPTGPDAPVMSAEPTEAFKTQQAARAEKIVEGFSNTQTKTCPHCKTVLPVTSVLCLCSYVFARDDFFLPRAVDINLGVNLLKERSRPE